MEGIPNVFKDETAFDGLIFTSIPLLCICFILLATFPGWHEEIDETGSEREVKPFPSRLVSQAALLAVTVAFLLTFVSAFWQHIASATGVTMAEHLSYGTVKGRTGTVAMVLGWGGVFTEAVVAIGLLIMILSIRLLQRLTDE